MIIAWSFDSQLQLNCQYIYRLHEFSFHLLKNRWSSDMNRFSESVKITINRDRWTKRVCHRFLPIDRYNRYQSNQIYRFLSIFRLINRYRFLSIDYSWALNYFSSVNNAGVLYGRLPPDFVFVSLYIVFNSINPLSLQKTPFSKVQRVFLAWGDIHAHLPVSL